MAMGQVATIPTMAVSLPQRLRGVLPTDTSMWIILGPLVGLTIWWLPLAVNPVAHRALAIVGVMLVYWVTETLEHGMTALIGCLLFWLLRS